MPACTRKAVHKMATKATQANGVTERLAALALLDEFLAHLPAMRGYRRYVGDAGYVAGWYLAEVLKRGVLPIVPMPATTLEPIPTWQRCPSNAEQMRKRHEVVVEAQARSLVRRFQGAQTDRRL